MSRRVEANHRYVSALLRFPHLLTKVRSDCVWCGRDERLKGQMGHRLDSCLAWRAPQGSSSIFNAKWRPLIHGWWN